MAYMTQQRSQRKITKKQIFSPSEAGRYALICNDEDNAYKILKSSDLVSEKDGAVELRNGESAGLIRTGTYAECHAELKLLQLPLKKNSRFNNDIQDDEDKASDEDDASNEQPFDLPLSSSTSFIQCPSKGFQTPAARRKNYSTVNDVSSPFVSRRVFSSKLNAGQHVSDTTTNSNNAAKSSSENRSHQTTNHSKSSFSFDDDNDTMDTNADSAMTRLEALSENQTLLIHRLKEEVSKLTNKVNRFFNSSSSKNQELSVYRDVNDKENYLDAVDHNGENLLDINARDPSDYARTVLRRLFTSTELASSILPSKNAHLFKKKPLDEVRFERLNKAIRNQYRISKNHYQNFYAAVIQKTLSDCIYNEGTRKTPQQSQPQRQQQYTTTASTDSSSILN